MKKVYVVTTGSYSDYRIMAVFSTMKAARACKKECEFDNIESFELDPEILRIPEGYDLFTIILEYDTGNLDHSYGCHPYIDGVNPETNKIRKFHPYGDKKKLLMAEMKVIAKDKRHATKIASELLAQHKAGV